MVTTRWRATTAARVSRPRQPPASADLGRLDREHLVEPPPVAWLARERGREEGQRALDGDLRADHPRAEHEHVHVVVFDALVSGVRVVADGRPDPPDLAR